ncbi:MAG: 2-hydroxyacyl-CoA dehydratase family protein [Chloroflexota bacterium]
MAHPFLDSCRDWPARYPNRRAIGYLCTYVPEEILHAAGFVPVRLLKANDAIAHADAHLQSYCCALARSALDQALAGKLGFLEGMVFPHTCDTIQCLADVWRVNFPGLFVTTIVQPVAVEGPHAQSYLVAELRRFLRRLEDRFGISVTDEALGDGIRVHNRTRQLLGQLSLRREQVPATTYFDILRASTLMPKEEFNDLLAEMLLAMDSSLLAKNESTEKSCSSRFLTTENAENTEKKVKISARSACSAVKSLFFSGVKNEPRGENAFTTSKVTSRRPRLILVGPYLDDPSLLKLIHGLGGQVVADDVCTGSRYFETPVSEDGDPVQALAQRYLERRPCPCKAGSLPRRSEALIGLAKVHQAEGVVFVLPKFCDPHAWDYPPLAQALDKAGVPHLLLETEQTVSGEQMRTRIQAFLEMISYQ